MKINNIGDLKKIINDLDDDFKLEIHIMEHVSESHVRQMGFLPQYIGYWENVAHFCIYKSDDTKLVDFKHLGK